jgi:hypothetical protein
MASLKERHLAAVTSVAKHLNATVAQGADTRAAVLVAGRKRIPVNIVTIESRVPRGSRLKPPRLRFDRVVLRLLERLRTALQDAVPRGVTVVVTVTAPIRQWSKTATKVEEGVRALLGKRSRHAGLTDTINGNEVQVRLMRGGKTSTSRLAGFVHNRDSDPAPLFDLAQTLLERTRKGLSGESWLVLAIEDEPSWLETYRHVCSQLFAQADLHRVVLVGRNGAVSTSDS